MRILVGVGTIGAAAAPLRLVRALSASGPHDTRVATVTPWTPSHAVFGSAYAVTVHQDAIDVLRAAQEDAGRLPVSVREVVERSVLRGLSRAAHEQDADLIVLGGRGRGRSAVSERLATRGCWPVASVPDRWGRGATPLRRIGVWVEREPAGRFALEFATGLAAASGAALRLVGGVELAPSVELARRRDPAILEPVYRDQRARLDAALERIDAGVPVHSAVRVGTPAQLAHELVAELDLLVVTVRPWPALSLARARRLARHAACALVLVPTRPREWSRRPAASSEVTEWDA